MEYRLYIGEREERATIERIGDLYRIGMGGRVLDVDARRVGAVHLLLVDGHSHEAEIERRQGGYEVHLPGGSFDVLVEPEVLARAGRRGRAVARTGPVQVESPMPGVVVDVKVALGDRVEHGEPLLIVEAMKMQNEFAATASGVVTAIAVDAGDTVAAGQLLLTIDVGDAS